APDGRLLALSTYHSVHGYVTLSASAHFPNDRRHDQAAVRAYRAALAQPNAPAFGIRLSTVPGSTDVYLLADAIPHTRFQVVPEADRGAGRLSVHVTTWAPRPGGEAVPAAVQTWRFHNATDQPASLAYAWDGALSLTRASYTQLTERGSLPPRSTALELTFDGQKLSVVAPDVGAAAVVLGLPAGPAWQRSGHGPLPITARGRLTVPPQQDAQLTLIYALGQTPEAHAVAASVASLEPRSSLAATLSTYQARWLTLDPDVAGLARLLAHRAQAYVLDCCALPVDEGICLLTDHQILPLSWTRDAYFLLQGLRPTADTTALDLLRRHLLWLFETAHRPNGYWGRAYLANGHPKDQIFQLDQQCYPLLELVEYATLTADEATVTRLLPHLHPILDVVQDRRARNVALFSTEETPADDPLPLPYHFSSQVLLWYTLRQLAALNARWPFTMLDLAGLADAIRVAVQHHLVAEHQGHRLFAYATDLQGTYRFYHDANDLPAVLAPLWGFCSADDPIWRATMDFAFSPANAGGYYPGPAGGLGSVHTPGPWPLGDVQEFLYARLVGDDQRAQAVLHRLVTTACWDGALPEARDENTSAVRSRHWFAWPGAALLAALVHPAWQP
ncbi:MAG: glycoside hydrolase family 125 protein, partial [Anaerolineae bacterium]